MRESLKSKIAKWILFLFRTAFLLLMCYIILKPFISMVLSGFMSPRDLTDVRVEKVPVNWSFYYWKHAWQALDLGKTGVYTLICALGSSIIQVIISTLVGYGLGRFNFKGKTLLMGVIIATMLVPFQVYGVAQYLMFRNFPLLGNLINTPYSLYILSFCCMGLKQGLYIYITKTFFEGLPKELEQAAYIDGAGTVYTFLRVMVPNVKNVIITVFLLSFSWLWTDNVFTEALNNSVNTLAARVASNLMQTSTVASVLDYLGTAIAKGCGVIIMIIPLLVLFIFCQNALQQSVSRSGMAN